MACIARNWKVDGVMLHYNRGCEGTALGVAENRFYLLDQSLPVLSFEGNMGDASERNCTVPIQPGRFERKFLISLG